VKKIIFTVTSNLVFDQRMKRICSTLADAGYDVMLVGRKLKNSPALSAENYKQQRLHCWFAKGKLFYAEYNIRLFFYLLFKKADCICAIDLDTILPVYCISSLKGIRRVYDAHEYFSQLDEVVSRPGIYRIWHWIEKKLLPRFLQGYTVCESLAVEFKKNYDVDYVVIRNVPVLQSLSGKENKEKLILYQGAVNKGRSLEKLVTAMKEINSGLWICGDGNFMKEMKEAVVNEGVLDKVLFMGMLEPELLKKKTAEAYIAINPFDKNGLNQYLSLSNKFFDYIHAAVPQVTMNYPEYRKINERYEVAVLIDEPEPAAIAGAVNKLLNDTQLYTRLRENCLKAREELNWQIEKEKLLKFYQEIFNA
jgi:glycosyltransferase involved in cell wall biosynthesis